MKLHCSRESLLNHINIVSKAVSNRSTLPILECIVLSANQNKFKLTGTDLELGIESESVEMNIEEEGTVALEAKMFSEIIRKVSGETVTIQTDENYLTMITCGSSKFKIMGKSSEEFPVLPKVEKTTEYTVLQQELRNMIRQTIFSIAQDDSKPVLTGELIEIENQTMNMVSVDGYRISYKKTNIQGPSGKASAIIPGKTLSEISKILSSEPEETVSISFTEKHILFDLGSSIVVSRLIEGDFIRYAQSFTEDYKTKMILNRSEFVSSLERASLVSRDARKTPVKMEIMLNSLVITSNSEIGTANEEVQIEMDGEPLTIAFNPKYLIDALKVIEDEKVSVQFTTSLSPCIMKPLETDIYKYLILPLRM